MAVRVVLHLDNKRSNNNRYANVAYMGFSCNPVPKPLCIINVAINRLKDYLHDRIGRMRSVTCCMRSSKHTCKIMNN